MKPKKKLISTVILQTTVILLLCITPNTWAIDFISPKHLGSDAKSIGLGQLHGFSTQAYAVFKNPAYLKQIKGISLSTFKTEIIEADYFNTALAGNTWGLAYMTVESDFWTTIKNESNELEKNKKTEYYSSIYYLAYQFDYEKIPVGVALKYYDYKLDTLKGNAYNLDVGFYLERFLKLGELSCVVKDILQTKYTYSNKKKETIPTEMISSLKIPFQKNWIVYPQLRLQKGTKFRSLLGCGIEYKLLDLCSLYGGYREYYVLGAGKKRSGLSGGISLGTKMLQVDYALQEAEYEDQNLYHYLSLVINF